MRKTATAVLGATLLAAAALPAMAQPPGSEPGRDPITRRAGAMFERIDADRDGRITWDEGWAFVQQRFAAADSNNDGGLTQEEMQAAFMRGRPGRQGQNGAENAGQAESRRASWSGAMFRALDANRDSRVTLDEVRPAAEARFRAFDANLDNAVSRDELPRRRHGSHGHRGRHGGQENRSGANPG